MFNVGGAEIFVILLVALIVLGPQRLPGAIRQVGQFMGELRKISAGFQREMKGAFDEVERSQQRLETTPPTRAEAAARAQDDAEAAPRSTPARDDAADTTGGTSSETSS